MSTAAMTSMLLDRLRGEHPGRVALVGEDSLARLRRDPRWGRVGAYPIGSPDFLRPCKRHLQAGRRLVIVEVGGRGIHIYANRSPGAQDEEAQIQAPAPSGPVVTITVPRPEEGKVSAPIVEIRQAPPAKEEPTAPASPSVPAAPSPSAGVQARARRATPMVRASALEARPPVGVAPFSTVLKNLPELELRDALPPPVGLAAAELDAHHSELLTLPLFSAWPVMAYALRGCHVEGVQLVASFYLFPTAAAQHRRQAVGQLHVRAGVGEPALSDAWVEGSGLVFDRQAEEAPAGPSEVLELGAAGEADAPEEEEEESYTGGGMSLQILFRQAEAEVDEDEDEDEDEVTDPGARPAARSRPDAQKPPAPRPVERPAERLARVTPSPPPEAKWSLGQVKAREVGLLALLLAAAGLKLTLDQQEAHKAQRQLSSVALQPLPDPYLDAPLRPLPGGMGVRVRRARPPSVVGPLGWRVTNAYVELATPRMEHCYHAYLLAAEDGGGTGEVKLRLNISEDGSLSEISADVGALGGADLGACLEESFEGLSFPTPELASATVASYALSFGLLPPQDAKP